MEPGHRIHVVVALARPRLNAALTVLAVCALLLTLTACAGASADPAADRQIVGLLDDQVTAAAIRSSPDDPMYFDSGVWVNSTTTCWSCSNGGLATAAATLWRATGRTRPDLLSEAVQTIDTAIATRQADDGSFSPPRGSADGQTPPIATMFFGVEMGATLDVLSPVLDSSRAARWKDSLARAANYLINSGNTIWYANGNINLGYTELLYMAARATGNPRFRDAYESSLAFVLAPPQDRFPGDGLQIARQPSNPDGSDGAGYLAENGPGGAGFDPEYTELQLDAACRLYLLSGDTRVLRLANLLANMLMTRVGQGWMLDTSAGTRHTEASRQVPFLTSALAVLGWWAGRGDLAGQVSSQLASTAGQYALPWYQTNDVFRRALGNDISVIALAAGPDSLSAAAPAATAGATTPGHAQAALTHKVGMVWAVTLTGNRRLTSRGVRVRVRGRIHSAVRRGHRVVRIQRRRHHRWRTVRRTKAANGAFRARVMLPRSANRYSVRLRAVVRGVGVSRTLRLSR
jgi:hypothetical protein